MFMQRDMIEWINSLPLLSIQEKGGEKDFNLW